MRQLNQRDKTILHHITEHFHLNENLLCFIDEYFVLKTYPAFPKTEQGIFEFIEKERVKGFTEGLFNFIKDPKRTSFHTPLFSLFKKPTYFMANPLSLDDNYEFTQNFKEYLIAWTFLCSKPEISKITPRTKIPVKRKKNPALVKSIIAVLTLVCLAVFIFSGIKLYERKKAEKDFARDKAKIDRRIDSLTLGREKIPVLKYEDGMKAAEDVLDALSEEYNTKNIIAYLEIGPIKEPIVHASTLNEYLWNDYNGNKNYNGSAFLFYANSGIRDSSLALFAHAMLDGTRFHYFQNESTVNEAGLDNLKKATLYSRAMGTEFYDLVFVGTFDEQVFHTVQTWTLDGVRRLRESEPNNLIYKDNFTEVRETDRYLVLSTCADAWGAERTIAVYKLNKDTTGYSQKDKEDGNVVTTPPPPRPEETVPQETLDALERPAEVENVMSQKSTEQSTAETTEPLPVPAPPPDVEDILLPGAP